MGRTKINVNGVMNASTQVSSSINYVVAANSSFDRTKSDIDSRIKNRANINSRLNSVRAGLSSLEEQLVRIRSVVHSGAGRYQSTDDTIESRGTRIRADVGAHSNGGVYSNWASYFKIDNDEELSEKNVYDSSATIKKDDDKKKKSLWSWDDTWDVVEKFGPFGTGISAIGQWITGGDAVKGALKFGSGVADVVSDVTETLSSGNSFNWKDLFGLNATKNSLNPGDFIADKIDEYKFSKDMNNLGKASVVAKWVGKGLTVATTAYENFVTEREGNSTGRALSETVGETAVKVVTGTACSYAATALVTGAVGALGIVGAPAIATTAAVGVVAVGISWAADKVCEHFTGKDVAEWASDMAIDTVTNIGKAVGNGAKAVAGKISGWWNKLTG